MHCWLELSYADRVFANLFQTSLPKLPPECIAFISMLNNQLAQATGCAQKWVVYLAVGWFAEEEQRGLCISKNLVQKMTHYFRSDQASGKEPRELYYALVNVDSHICAERLFPWDLVKGLMLCC